MKEKHQYNANLPNENITRIYYEQAIREARPTEQNEADLELLKAAREGDHEKIKVLLSQNANQSEESSQGRTVLHLAAREGHESLARILIDNGEDIHKMSSNGETAFFIAVKSGHHSIVKLLLENGQDVHERSNCFTGWASALFIAVKRKHIDVVRTLLEYGGVDKCRSMSRTSNALILGIESGEEEMVALLLRSGYDSNRIIDVKSSWECTTPLHVAVKSGPRMTKLILDANPFIEVEAGNMWITMTPLVSAITRGDFRNNREVVKLLLDAGATISPEEWENLSPERQSHHADLFPLPIPPLTAKRLSGFRLAFDTYLT